MKKIIVFCFLLLAVSSTMLFKMSKRNPIFNLSGATKACFVSNEKFDDCTYMTCGDLVFNYCPMSAAKENLNRISKSSAIQVYCKDVKVKKILNSLKCTDYTKSEVGNLTVYAGWTPFYDGFVLVENKKINLQIAVKDFEIVLGFPAILSGFWLKNAKKS